MICGSTVSLLVTSRQPVFQDFKEILTALSCSLGDCKQTLNLLVILHLTIFYYLSINIADQNMSFYGQVGRVIGQISI